MNNFNHSLGECLKKHLTIPNGFAGFPISPNTGLAAKFRRTPKRILFVSGLQTVSKLGLDENDY